MPNTRPYITSDPTTHALINEEYIYKIEAADDDGDHITLDQTDSWIADFNGEPWTYYWPEWLTLSDPNVIFSGTFPDYGDEPEFQGPYFSCNSSCDLEFTEDESYIGDWSLKMTSTDTSPYTHHWHNVEDAALSVAEVGETWTFSVWAKTDGPPRWIRLWIFALDDNYAWRGDENTAEDVGLSETTEQISTNNLWTQHYITHTFDYDTNYNVRYISVRMDGPPKYAHEDEKIVYFDGLRLEKGTEPNNDGTALLSGTPLPQDEGYSDVRIFALDGNEQEIWGVPVILVEQEQFFTIQVSETAPPVADDLPIDGGTFSVNQDESIEIDLADGVTDFDTPQDQLMYFIDINNPPDGTLTYLDGFEVIISDEQPLFTGDYELQTKVIYTPDINHVGDDSFGYYASDTAYDEGLSNIATVNITVVDVNDPPTMELYHATENALLGDPVDINEDEFLTFEVSVHDSDTAVNEMTCSVTSSENEVVSSECVLEQESVGWYKAWPTLTPNANWNGTATITVTVSDGEDAIEETFSLRVNAVSDAPVADDINVITDEETPVTITLAGTDIDNIPEDFTYHPQPPTWGSLSGNTSNPDWEYTPVDEFNDTDTFTYRIWDGDNWSNEATVTITVGAINDPPELTSIENQFTTEDNPLVLTIEIDDTDSDEDELTCSVSSSEDAVEASVGEVISTDIINRYNATLTLTPAENWFGEAEIEVTVTDDGDPNLSDSQTFILTVNPIDDPPVVQQEITIEVNVNEEKNIDLRDYVTDIDTNPEDLHWGIGIWPEWGTILNWAEDLPELTYITTNQYDDSFSFYVFDTGGLVEGTVSITVMGNVPPELFYIYDQEMNEDDPPLTLTLSASDIDNNTLTFSAVSYEENVSTGIDGDQLTLTLEQNWNGEAEIEVTVTDDGDPPGSESRTFRLTVHPVNDPPVLTQEAIDGIEITVLENTEENPSSVDITLTDYFTDSDDTVFTYWVEEPLWGGSFNETFAPDLTYTPLIHSNVPDSFRFQVFDDFGNNSAIATVTINITAVNNPPVIPVGWMIEDQVIYENTSVEVGVYGTDPDPNEVLTASVESDTESVTVTMDGARATLTPDPDWYGIANMTSYLTDSGGLYDSQEFTLTVLENLPPEVESFTTSVNEGGTVEIILSDYITDPEGDNFTISVETQPIYGDFNIDTMTYTHYGTEEPEDSFTYYATDFEGNRSDTATVTIDINPINDPPEITSTPVYGVAEDTTYSYTIIATDSEDDGLTFEATDWDLNELPNWLSLEDYGDGTALLSGTPLNEDVGSHNIRLVVLDGNEIEINGNPLLNNSQVQEFTITVANVNDPPILDEIGDQTVNEDTNLFITLSAIDVDDGDILTYSAIEVDPDGNEVPEALRNIIITVSGETLTLKGIQDWYGTANIKVTVSDGYLTDSETFVLEVYSVAEIPIPNSFTINLDQAAEPFTFSFEEHIDYSEFVESIHLYCSGWGNDNIGYIFHGDDFTQDLDDIFTWTFNPNPNLYGFARCWYWVNDDSGYEISFYINVAEVNQPPIANDFSIETLEEESVSFVFDINDPTKDLFTISIETPPEHGTVDFPDTEIIDTMSGESLAWWILGFTTAFRETFTEDETIVWDLWSDSYGVIHNFIDEEDTEAETILFDIKNIVGDFQAENQHLVFSTNDNTSAGNDPSTPYYGKTIFLGNRHSQDVWCGDSYSEVVFCTDTLGVIAKLDNYGLDSFFESVLWVDYFGKRLQITSILNQNGQMPFDEDCNDQGYVTTVYSGCVYEDNIFGTGLPYRSNMGSYLHPMFLKTWVGSFSNIIFSPDITPEDFISQPVYTPDPNWYGEDFFTYRANDGELDSELARVDVIVEGVIDVLVLEDISDQEMDEDETLVVSITILDPDNLDTGLCTDCTIDASGENVDIVVNDMSIEITPFQDWNGTTEITVEVEDITGRTDTKDFGLTVNPINDPPVVDDITVSTLEDTPVEITFTGTDIEGDDLIFSVVSEPTNGSLSGTDSSRTYTPNENYNGSDSFTYQANDDMDDSNVGIVTITIDPVPDDPIFDVPDQTYELPGDTWPP